MNKKLTISTVAMSLLTAHAALAEEPVGATIWDGFSGFMSPDWSRDFSATLGVKVWMNEWSRDSFISSFIDVEGTPIFAVADDAGPDNRESDIEPVPIPQVSVRYKWLFVTGGYFAETQYQFAPIETTLCASTVAAIVDNTCADAEVESTSLWEQSGDRTEWDASAGVYIHPYVAILGGYKKVRQQLDTTRTIMTEFSDPSLSTPTTVEQILGEIDVEGPTIGITASVPIGGGFGVYGSYGHGFMDAEISGIDEGDPGIDFDATYDVVEGGFSYTHGMDRLMPHLPLSAATVYAGYRYQNISTDFGEEPDRSDVTRGFAVGVNLTF